MEMQALRETAIEFGMNDPERYGLWRERLEQDRPTVELLRRADLRASQAMVRLDDLIRREPRNRRAANPPDQAEENPDTTAHEVVERTKYGTESVSDRVAQALRTITERTELNAFTAVFGERALDEARSLDERLGRGKAIGPLGGVIVAVKDLIAVEGYRTTGATRALQLEPSKSDAVAVARLRSAGAVIIGAANLHALAYGALSTSSDVGAVGNPLRPEAIAGGSSGGSAAAVRAGMADLALGTDTAGSIRIPSALCGVVGLKPTYGRIPTTGVHALGPSLDHVGPITRTVADAALSLQVMSDHSFQAADTRWRDLDGVVVGIPRTYFRDHLDPEVREALESALTAVTDLGGQIREVDIPSLEFSSGAMLCTLAAEAFDVHRELLREHGDLLPDDVRLRLEVGMFRTGPDYVRAQRFRAVLQAEMDQTLRDTDVLLTPTVTVTAPPHGVSELDVEGAHWTTQFALTRLTMPFNLTGHPALTLPWATDRHGGSIGMQLAGRPMDEVTLLGAAEALENTRTRRGADMPTSTG